MSVKVVASVLQRSPADRSTRMIELVLAEFANGRGVCWPSIPMIAERGRCGRATVFRALERLKTMGELRVRSGRGRGHRSTYYLTPGREPVDKSGGNGRTMRPFMDEKVSNERPKRSHGETRNQVLNRQVLGRAYNGAVDNSAPPPTPYPSAAATRAELEARRRTRQ